MSFFVSSSMEYSWVLFLVFCLQELPPGCGPPSPSLKGIFGREMGDEELATARDGSEHLQTSQASRRLTALSAATPKELASHVQVWWAFVAAVALILRPFP